MIFLTVLGLFVDGLLVEKFWSKAQPKPNLTKPNLTKLTFTN